MNIEQIPTEQLNRCAVISIMDSEKPFIESFTNGETFAPVVFLRGVPIPYNIFVLYMAMRFAPDRTKGQMPKFYSNVGGFALPMEDDLRKFWERVEMPSEMRKKIESFGQKGPAVHDLVKQLYAIHQKADADESKRSFRELIHRIEQDYESSLIDPVKV